MGGFVGTLTQAIGGGIALSQEQDAGNRALDINAAQLKRGWGSEDLAAVDSLQRGARAIGLAREQGTDTAGAARVALAANNLDASSGTGLALQQKSIVQGELNANTIRANALAEALGHQQTSQKYHDELARQAQAQKDKIQAGYTKLATSTVGSFLSSAGSAIGG